MKELILSDYCRWNDDYKAQTFLNSNKDVDITYDGGIFFQFAVKYQNEQMLKTLIEFFITTKLQDDQETYSYKTAKNQLMDILAEVKGLFEIPLHIQSVMEPYLPHEDNDNEQDLGEYDISPTFFSSNGYSHEGAEILGMESHASGLVY